MDKDLADRLFERLCQHLPQTIVVDENTTNDGLRHSKEQLYGTWRPTGVNERFLVSRYDGLGHFGPHRDQGRVDNENHRSLITLAGYLTDRPAGFGGATRFVRDEMDVFQREDGLFTTPEEDILHRIEADKAGKAVLFLHDLMHDGEPLKEGSPPKWFFTTDVTFERDPETAPKLSENQKEARRILKEAEAMEMEGQISAAKKCYNRAYRLDPSLEHP